MRPRREKAQLRGDDTFPINPARARVQSRPAPWKQRPDWTVSWIARFAPWKNARNRIQPERNHSLLKVFICGICAHITRARFVLKEIGCACACAYITKRTRQNRFLSFFSFLCLFFFFSAFFFFPAFFGLEFTSTQQTKQRFLNKRKVKNDSSFLFCRSGTRG